jgi:hypothetical protein
MSLAFLRKRRQAAELHMSVGLAESSRIRFRLLPTLRFYQAQELVGVVGEAGEDCAQVAVS